MKIFSHRGLWDTRYLENSIEAIKEAFIHELDVETDVRYIDNQYIISHDIPNNKEKLLLLSELLCLLEEYPDRHLALHYKYDDWKKSGATSIIDILLSYKDQVFLFDMSIKFCEKLKEIDPNIKTGVSIGDKKYHDAFANLDDALESNIDIIWADENRKLYTKHFFNLCKDAGKVVYCIAPDLALSQGHPNAVSGFDEAILNLINLGADGICTDRSMEVQEIYANNCSSSRKRKSISRKGL